MSSKLPLDLLQMDRAALEALDHAQLVELVCRLRTIAVEATERLALDSTNSSRPRTHRLAPLAMVGQGTAGQPVAAPLRHRRAPRKRRPAASRASSLEPRGSGAMSR
jgi:hypothetical protein